MATKRQRRSGSRARSTLAVIVLPVFSGNALSISKPRRRCIPSLSSSSSLKAIALPVDEATATTSPIRPHEKTSRNYKDAPWVENLDYDAFAKDVNALGKDLISSTGEEDVKHLNKILRWQNIAAIVGISTMWLPFPNPVAIAALSTWTYASWTMVAHHTCHGGYNRVDAGKYNSRGFALGSIKRRVLDWCDWMLPEAWNVEHNRLHHFHLGEDCDPDNVERNMSFLRDSKLPMPLKYVVAALMIPMWKWFYYAPNTFKELQVEKWRSQKKELPKNMDPTRPVTLQTLLFPTKEHHRAANELVKPVEFFSRVLAPFFLTRFVLLPLPLLLIPQMGSTFFRRAVLNLIAADLLTNAHGFASIVTNHAGDDMYVFGTDQVKPKTASYYVRQVAASVNYAAGTDAIDFGHGFLNYQIEHHVWPDLSMLQYQRGAPKLRAICEKHGVPYVQESVLKRVKKTVDVMVGRTSMRRFPVELEPQKDKATASNGI